MESEYTFIICGNDAEGVLILSVLENTSVRECIRKSIVCLSADKANTRRTLFLEEMALSSTDGLLQLWKKYSDLLL